MKMFLLAVALLGCTNALNCMVQPTKGAAGSSTTCAQGETQCKGPGFDIRINGYTDQLQACGICEQGAPCIQCNEDDCNVVKELEDMECNTYEWKDTAWVKVITMATCKKFIGEGDMCRRPIGTTVRDDLLTYCGTCEQNTECSNTPTVSCVDKKGDGTIATCEGTVCKGPVFATATGYTDQLQACGQCDTGSSEKCIQCDEDDCNVVKEVEDMKCNTYVWDDENTAWVKKMTADSTPEEMMVTCTKFQGEGDMCRRPIGTTVGDDIGTYCGTCEQGEKCSNTAPVVPDSGARGVTATVLTLIAALFVLA